MKVKSQQMKNMKVKIQRASGWTPYIRSANVQSGNKTEEFLMWSLLDPGRGRKGLMNKGLSVFLCFRPEVYLGFALFCVFF